MSADLHIHVLDEKFTEEHYIAFCSNTFGSKFFNPGYRDKFEERHKCDLYELCAETPNVWVGEVSWLKAALFEDAKSFIPEPIESIAEIIGENFPVIDDALIEKIGAAMNKKNDTNYVVAEIKDLIDFLNNHKGERVFTISW